MSPGKPVARLVAPVIVRVGFLVTMMAAIAVAGVVVSTAAVHHLTSQLQPAAAANKDSLQDLSDMQGSVRAYAQSGQGTFLDDYRQALARLSGHQQQVRQYAADDPDLARLVARQDAAAQAWLQQYAEVRVAREGGSGTFDRELFRIGVKRFAEFREAHTETMVVLDAQVRGARDAAELRLRGTILAIAVLTLIGGVVIARSRRRLLSELADPLKDLERVVQRMAAQDRSARAADAGPSEARAIASALNDLADAQARAHAVEGRIQDELRNLDTAKDDFVSNVSHELRTPLTTISGYLELVADEFEDRMEPRHEKMLAASRRNVARLRLLIDDLLTLSRAEARDIELEPIDLGAIVNEVATDVRMTAVRRGIRIEVDVPGDPLCVLGDRPMLHRALLNLVTNAVKFSHDGGDVEVAALAGDQQHAVVVRDHGIGIPESEMDRLGTRFFRASNAVANEIAGTGLGVRIVSTIVDKHDGQLVIDSAQGRGTTVTVQLPAEETPDPGAFRAPTMTIS